MNRGMRKRLIIGAAVLGVVVIFMLLLWPRSGPSPSKDMTKGQIMDLGTEHNYLVVQEGDRFRFPIRRKDTDLDLSDEGLFEIIGILGNPKDPESQLTNFEKGDIWLVLKHPNIPERMFIFRLRTGYHHYGADRVDKKNMECLRRMFKEGVFYTSAEPNTQATNMFLCVELVPCDAWAKISKFPDKLEVRGREVEISGNYMDYLYAETLKRRPTRDKLVIGLRESKLFSWSYISDTSVKLCYFRVRILKKKEIEDRQKLERELPAMMTTSLSSAPTVAPAVSPRPTPSPTPSPTELHSGLH